MQRAHLYQENALPQLRPDQIPALAAVAYQAAGIRLDAGKLDFLQTRLFQRVLDSKAFTFRAYIDLLEGDEEERQTFVEALTVHTTSFFRESAQYDWLLSTGLPEMTLRGTNIVIWSAACSTGQEGWTSLMVAEAYRRDTGRNFTCRLIGTDISKAVLEKAERAIYQQQDVDNIATKTIAAYFLRARNQDGRYRIVPALRRSAEWRWGNLATGKGMAGIQANVAFLRNVLIYFDSATKDRVVDRVVRGIRPGGYLLTGHSETGFKHPDLVTVGPSIYQKERGS
jgi:chemotaxis protein methyltransferase CheR